MAVMENRQRQPRRLGRIRQEIRETAAVWRAPGIAGVIGSVGSGTVWYYSSVPCTMAAALAGLCNPGVFASYITLPVLTSCLGIGAGCATLVGGYNIVMLSRERQRADAAEERAIKAQERAVKTEERAVQVADEVRERLFQIEEERREEHRQAMQERRQADEIRRQADEERLQMERERHQAEQERLRMERELRQAADAERRQLEQQRYQAEQDRRDEHRQFMAAQREMLETVTQLVQRQNGRPLNDANP